MPRHTWATLAEEVDVLTLTVPAFGLGVVREPHTAHHTHSSPCIHQYPVTLEEGKCDFHSSHHLRFAFSQRRQQRPRSQARRACRDVVRRARPWLAASGTRFQEHQESRHEAQTMRMIQFRIFLPWAPASLFGGG